MVLWRAFGIRENPRMGKKKSSVDGIGEVSGAMALNPGGLELLRRNPVAVEVTEEVDEGRHKDIIVIVVVLSQSARYPNERAFVSEPMNARYSASISQRSFATSTANARYLALVRHFHSERSLLSARSPLPQRTLVT
ncbi:hypothetical protein LR48_Vigan08g112800 [Vigna angularis]|uniref:Uncharacterized protein n=1 Tax=Phaseolus angularis TaxID=3914 RepID=A0A0L9V5I4_PHAAN|nr:hypothetical protein LR48_Vigan08g112800 [Vigna angularis]